MPLATLQNTNIEKFTKTILTVAKTISFVSDTIALGSVLSFSWLQYFVYTVAMAAAL